jgi:hypothetical protein
MKIIVDASEHPLVIIRYQGAIEIDDVDVFVRELDDRGAETPCPEPRRSHPASSGRLQGRGGAHAGRRDSHDLQHLFGLAP